MYYKVLLTVLNFNYVSGLGLYKTRVSVFKGAHLRASFFLVSNNSLPLCLKFFRSPNLKAKLKDSQGPISVLLKAYILLIEFIT